RLSTRDRGLRGPGGLRGGLCRARTKCLPCSTIEPVSVRPCVGLALRRTLLRSEKNYPLWIDGDEYLLPDRQRIQRRAAGYEPLIAAKHVHLGEIALENRLLD